MANAIVRRCVAALACALIALAASVSAPAQAIEVTHGTTGGASAKESKCAQQTCTTPGAAVDRVDNARRGFARLGRHFANRCRAGLRFLLRHFERVETAAQGGQPDRRASAPDLNAIMHEGDNARARLNTQQRFFHAQHPHLTIQDSFDAVWHAPWNREERLQVNLGRAAFEIMAGRGTDREFNLIGRRLDTAAHGGNQDGFISHEDLHHAVYHWDSGCEGVGPDPGRWTRGYAA